MKKLLLILLLLFTLKSTSQTICDSVNISGSNWQWTASIGWPGSSIIMADYWITTDPLGNVLGEDSISNHHFAYSNSMVDTIVTCITVSFAGPWFFPGTCCLTFVWDGSRWNKHYISVWPSGLNEIQYIGDDNRMYDLFGRELFATPKNRIYIKNNKLYIEK